MRLRQRRPLPSLLLSVPSAPWGGAQRLAAYCITWLLMPATLQHHEAVLRARIHRRLLLRMRDAPQGAGLLGTTIYVRLARWVLADAPSRGYCTLVRAV